MAWPCGGLVANFPVTVKGLGSIIESAAPSIEPRLLRFSHAFSRALQRMIIARNGDEALIAQGMAHWQADFEALMVGQYKAVQQAAADVITYGLRASVSLHDPAMLDVLETGGKRMGLVRILNKDKLFTLIARARADGENPLTFAPRIAEATGVPPWRARTIARTETKYAQNRSQIAAYEATGNVRRVELVDGQLGPPRSDEDCINRDGRIVSLDDARLLADAEHPNGTLTYSPIVDPPTQVASARELDDARKRLERLPAQDEKRLERIARSMSRRIERG